MSTKFVLKQFAADADEPSDALTEFVFEGGLFTIGTDASNTIVLDEGAPEQAVVIEEGAQLRLINRAAGTFFNNQSLRREAMQTLTAGDEIRIGKNVIRIVGEADFPIQPPIENSSSIESPPAVVDKPIVQTARETVRAENLNSIAEKPTRNFSDVLNALRTEEDKFYFIVKNGLAEPEARIPIEQAEMPIGLNSAGQITCAVEQIQRLYAVVRKDWSGIVVEAQPSAAVFVNDQAIKTVVRLRNGDRLSFNGAGKNKPRAALELHEPTSLVALESILETRGRAEKPFNNFSQTAAVEETNRAAAPTVPIIERKFFGHFSFFEIAAMIVGTLIASVLIFLGLEFTV